MEFDARLTKEENKGLLEYMREYMKENDKGAAAIFDLATKVQCLRYIDMAYAHTYNEDEYQNLRGEIAKVDESFMEKVEVEINDHEHPNLLRTRLTGVSITLAKEGKCAFDPRLYNAIRRLIERKELP